MVMVSVSFSNRWLNFIFFTVPYVVFLPRTKTKVYEIEIILMVPILL